MWLVLPVLLLLFLAYIAFTSYEIEPTIVRRNLIHWSSASEPDEPFVGINYYTVDPNHPNVGIVLCRSYGEDSMDFTQHIHQCQIDFTNAFRTGSIEWFDSKTDFEWKNLNLELIYLCKIKTENESRSLAYQADNFFEVATLQTPIDCMVGRHYDAASQHYPMLNEHLKRIKEWTESK